MADRMLTAKQVSALVGYTPAVVRRKANSGALPAACVGPGSQTRKRLWRESAIQGWIRRQGKGVRLRPVKEDHDGSLTSTRKKTAVPAAV